MVSKFGTLCAVVLGHLALSVVGQSSASNRSSASSAASSAVSSSASAAATRVIMVGNGDHKFRPEITQAEIGDIIEFQFFPPNHSVVRAEYLYPCIPYEMTGRGKTGFWSGFKPVDAILSSPPTWRIRINDTNPIFFYCSAVGSCINYGMVGVINPNSTTSLEQHRQVARDSAYMLNPGESFPGEGGSTTSKSSSATSSATSSVAPVTITASPSPSASSSPESSGGLAAGAIAGIVVGAVAVVALAAGLCFFMGRTKTLKQEIDRNSSLPPHVAPSMLQHASYMPVKSNMTDASSRNSFSGSPRPFNSHNQQYEPFPGMTSPTGPFDTKPEYLVSVNEALAYGPNSPRSPGFSQSGTMRHPSVLLNPNDPQEMHAPATYQRTDTGHRSQGGF